LLEKTCRVLKLSDEIRKALDILLSANTKTFYYLEAFFRTSWFNLRSLFLRKDQNVSVQENSSNSVSMLLLIKELDDL